MTKEGWITRKANAAAKRAASQAVAEEAVKNAQQRVAAKDSVSSPVAAPEPRRLAPVPAPMPSSGASRELYAPRELPRLSTDTDRAEPSEPFAPVVAPTPPTVYKRVWEYEKRYYEDRELKRETENVESYICSRGLCYRTKVHRIEIELIFVPSYPRQFLGVEFALGEPRDGMAVWVPKSGQSLPRYGDGDRRR